MREEGAPSSWGTWDKVKSFHWAHGAQARDPQGREDTNWGRGYSAKRGRGRLSGVGEKGAGSQQGSSGVPAGPGRGAPVGSGGRPGLSRGSSVAEALTTRLEPRTGLVRAGRPGLGKRRRGWISCREDSGVSSRMWAGRDHRTPGPPTTHPDPPAALLPTHMAEEFIGES